MVRQSQEKKGASYSRSLTSIKIICFLSIQKREVKGPNVKLVTSLSLNLYKESFNLYFYSLTFLSKFESFSTAGCLKSAVDYLRIL